MMKPKERNRSHVGGLRDAVVRLFHFRGRHAGLLLIVFALGAGVAPREPPAVAWPRPGDVTGRDGAPMVLVPAGEFLMGSDESDDWASYWEKPQHRVTLKAYYIDKYEVPLGQYRRFLESVEKDGHRHCDPGEPHDRDHSPAVGKGVRWSEPQWPVERVGWWEAAAYCAWAGKRLPTDDVSPSENPKGPEAGPWRAIRGGSYDSPASWLRAAHRTRGGESDRPDAAGFRCAKDKD